MNEQWQELKETITELRDNDGTGTQQEVCEFLLNMMRKLESDVPDINVGNINCILDKISKEIKYCREDEEPHLCDYRYYINVGLDMALNIIDNYKTEREE